MHEIATEEMTPEFLACWRAAGSHLDLQVQDGVRSWIRAHPFPPFLEHLSFRLGNQLFFVRVVDASGRLVGPGALDGLIAVAEGNRGHPCLLPMNKMSTGNVWVAARAGWGLVDCRTDDAVDPVLLITDEKIEMTDWETHDFAVQVVREHLQGKGRKLMSWQSNPSVDPAIWFFGEDEKPEWVVVRVVRYPAQRASRPSNLADIASACEAIGSRGHFATVALASSDQFLASPKDSVMPLYRGHGMQVQFPGLD